VNHAIDPPMRQVANHGVKRREVAVDVRNDREQRSSRPAALDVCERSAGAREASAGGAATRDLPEAHGDQLGGLPGSAGM
jgi:hypothetical protein